MINKHIVIVRSTERGLSSLSQVSCDAIFSLLKEHYTNVGVKHVNNLSDLDDLVESKPDLVFLGMQFIPVNPSLGRRDTNKIWISEYLTKHQIAHTGSNHFAHDLGVNKNLAKQRIISSGLKTSPFYLARQNSPPLTEIGLTFPLFIKPVNRGGGLGIDHNSFVRDINELNAKVQSISDEFQSDSLIEEYLSGREFSVAILKISSHDGHVAMPLELIALPDEHGVSMLSSQVKSSNSERAIKVIDESLRQKVTSLALDVFSALGARDYGRIDIRLDKNGEPNFLEANLIPSLISGYGSFPKACVLNMDMPYEAMILSIVNLGFKRTANAIEDDAQVIMDGSLASPLVSAL